MYHLVHDETYALSEHLLAFKEACYDIGIEFGMFGMTCMDESEGGAPVRGPDLQLARGEDPGARTDQVVQAWEA